MRRLLWAIAVVLCFYVCASAQYVKVLGVAGKSASAITSGVSSTNKPFVTYPLSTINIYAAGTTTPLSIFSTSTGVVKANPFTATAEAYYDFFVASGTAFDVRISGVSSGVTITPFTRSGYTAPGTQGYSLAICGGTNDTSLLSTLNALGGTIQILNGITCASNTQTLTSEVQIDKGGLLKPLNSQTITLSTYPKIGVYQAFTNALSGQGTVTLNGPMHEIYPEWWKENTTPGTTDMTAAIQAAMDALPRGGVVQLQTATYLVTELRVRVHGLTIQGLGSHAVPLQTDAPTILYYRSLPDYSSGIVTSTYRGLVIRDLLIDIDGGTGGAAIKALALGDVIVEGVKIGINRGSSAFGVQLSDYATAFSSATNANPVVITLANHGLYTGEKVVIIGGTGNWTAINGTFTATAVSANTFSIPVNSTAFGAVAGTPRFDNAVITASIKHVVVGGPNDAGFLVGASSTSVQLDNAYSLGATNAGIKFYGSTYSQCTACASDSGLSGAYGYLVDTVTGITVSSSGAEANGKGYIRLTGGSTGVTVIGGRGVGNNTSATTGFGSFWQSDTGGNYNNSIIGGTDTNPNAATTASIYGDTGTLYTNLIGYNVTSFPKGYGGSTTFKQSFLSLVSGGELMTGSVVAGVTGAGGGGILAIQPKTSEAWAASLILDVGSSDHTIAASNTTSATSSYSTNGVGAYVGQFLYLTTVADSSGSVVVTFSSANFRSSGTQTTTASHWSTVVFRADGTKWNEVSRTTNLALFDFKQMSPRIGDPLGWKA